MALMKLPNSTRFRLFQVHVSLDPVHSRSLSRDPRNLFKGLRRAFSPLRVAEASIREVKARAQGLPIPGCELSTQIDIPQKIAAVLCPGEMLASRQLSFLTFCPPVPPNLVPLSQSEAGFCREVQQTRAMLAGSWEDL